MFTDPSQAGLSWLGIPLAADLRALDGVRPIIPFFLQAGEPPKRAFYIALQPVLKYFPPSRRS